MGVVEVVKVVFISFIWLFLWNLGLWGVLKNWGLFVERLIVGIRIWYFRLLKVFFFFIILVIVLVNGLLL